LRGTPRDPRNYELMTVFSPDIPEEEIQATIERVVGYITTATGEVTAVNRDSPWGRRRLAYPVRHASRDVRDGFYTLYHFAVAPNRVIDIEREIKLNDRIMRYLVTQHTPRPVEEPPAAEGTEAGEQAVSGDEAPLIATATNEEPTTEAAEEPAQATADETPAVESQEEEAGTDEAAPPEEA
jgi:small subunit ribosomal protein S6